MKYIITVFFIVHGLILSAQTSNIQQRTSINDDGAAPDSSAILDVQSTDKGILMPRMTSGQRANIVHPATGLLVFQSDSPSGFWFYADTSWVHLSTPQSTISDADKDTKIQVDKNNIDNDKIYFELDGTEHFVMDGPRLEVLNSGNSVFMGVGAGMHDDLTANNNVGIGRLALHQNIGGSQNVAVGAFALTDNTIGHDNTALGRGTLANNINGNKNVSVGFSSMFFNTSGNNNIGVGYFALSSNTTGNNNTASGFYTMWRNTTGSNNVAYGPRTMLDNTVGSSNVAIGAGALHENKDRSNLVAIGDSALFRNGEYTNFSYDAIANTAIGSKTLFYNILGRYNTATGYRAAYTNSSGIGNTAHGYLALYSNSGGSYCTALGYGANLAANNYNNITALGNIASCTASNQIRIGNSNVSSIGGYAGWTTLPCDNRFKKNISDDRVPGLAFISLLRPVTYEVDFTAMENWWAENYNLRDSSTYPEKYDKENILYTGFIAQEVEAAARSIGYDFSGVDAPKNDKDFYGLRYATFVVPLVKAVQELSMSNEQLTMSNEQLKKEVKAIKKRMAKIEEMLK